MELYRKRRRWTHKETLLLAQLYQDGKSDTEIAASIGKTASAVKTKRYYMGLVQGSTFSEDRLPTQEKPEQRALIMSLICVHKTVPAVCKAANLTRSCVRHHVDSFVKEGLLEYVPGHFVPTQLWARKGD
jgi:DNA-binding MarR family transcriptional regulator